jgi:CRP-like cAMP-binding protein
MLKDQLFGLNGLVNLSNLLFLAAFSVKDVLALRALSVVSYCVILPYYYFQQDPLWQPIFWGMTFIVINGFRIAALILERRPVVLNEREAELYRLAFMGTDKREFLGLALLAKWRECEPGEFVLRKGQTIAEGSVLISGQVDAVVDGRAVLALRAGQWIGDANTFAGLASPVDIVVRSRARIVAWDIKRFWEFAASRPGLRSRLLEIEATDLAAKFREVSGIPSGNAPSV